MCDLTLVVPTHNRPQLLAALLSYLEAQSADFQILVLDSSNPDALAANRARIAASTLEIEFRDLAHLGLEEKWRQGFHCVSTPFCALCADDDLVILDGVRRCLATLGSKPDAAAVQGYSLTFLPRPDGDMELNNIVYFTPSIEQETPVRRVNELFQRYQAPSYAVFRTATLQRIFDTLRPLTKILLRELLWSALTVIEGRLIRLPVFSYGRSMAPSMPYEHWHPLEWFSKDPDGLFAEYLRYRNLMASAIRQRPDNRESVEEVNTALDLIHFRYLARHAPNSALEFIAQQQIAGIGFGDYWPRREIQLPLIDSAGIGTSATNPEPQTMRGRVRCYHLFPSFFAPLGIEPPTADTLAGLIAVLDSYTPMTSQPG